MKVKGVIFDLDGTLARFNLDYETVRAEVRGYLLEKGVPPSVLSVRESVFEMLKKTDIFFKNSHKRAKVLEGIRNEALAIAEKFELEAAKDTNLLPGVVDTLKALKQMGLKIGLFTINSEKSTEFILKRFKLDCFFDATVPRNQVDYVKPHPEHLGTALKALGMTAADTVVVGDSVLDMRSAKELKAIAVGLPTGISTVDQLASNGANFIITSITDLTMLIEKINKT
jgi:HAD superfamily hydrolase (TIGR01549 family)